MINHFNILIIDDMKKILALLKDLVSHHKDINIFTALNAEEGLKIIFQNNIDLILTDIHMPNINGFEFLEFLSKNERTREIPVIFFTASKSIKDEIFAYKLGAADFIPKKINPEVLDLKLHYHVNILKKQKKHLLLLKNNQNIIIKQSRVATIGETVNIIIDMWKQSLDLISLTNSNIRYKIATNNTDTEFLVKKLDKVDGCIYNISESIEYITGFSNSEEKKINSILGDVMDKALTILKPIIKLHKICILTQYKVHNGINIYSNDLLQVFLHIIKNSIDAFIKKDIINPKITITIEEEANIQTITIKDNAGGIDKNIKENLSSSVSIEEEKINTGLGLYISKIILNKNSKGTINVENIKKGTCFIIKLKVKEL